MDYKYTIYVVLILTNTDVLELLGGDVIGVANKDAAVLGQQRLDFLEVVGLPFLSYLSPNHNFLLFDSGLR